MDVTEGLRIGWRNVRDHKLRSTLTTLGIIIGVAAVITFVTLGASLQADIIQTIAGDNTDVMYVSAVPEDRTDVAALTGRGQAVFTQHDVEQLRQVTGVQDVIPTSGIAASRVSHANDTVSSQWITVTTPGYFDAMGHTFVSGVAYAPGERAVVVDERAASMFDENVSVGDQITFTRAATGEQVNGTVVGIVSEPGGDSNSFFREQPRPSIYVPPDPYYKRTTVSPNTGTDQRVYARLLLTVHDVSQIQTVQGRVSTYLEEESDARTLKPSGYQFEVTTYDELVNQIKQVSNTFTAYITGIAVISLVVGAIGIANIMLVSVTERTREIGLMKAVGARNRDVLSLFLIEAVILGFLGSVLGALVGVVGGYIGTLMIGLPFRFHTEWLVASVIIGVFVGVLAGLYPAWSAARTDPIVALRHE